MRLAEQYRTFGHEVEIASFHDVPNFLPGMSKHAYFPFHVANRLGRHSDFDIVDAASGDAWLWGSIRPKNKLPAYVFRSHGLEHAVHIETLKERDAGNIQLSWKYPIYWGGLNLRAVATSARKADHCIFLNEQEKQYAVEHLGVPAEKCSISSNGLTDEFLKAATQIPICDDEFPHIAFVGSFIERKGTKYLISAMNQLLKKHPELRLGLIGTGKHESDVLSAFQVDVQDQIRVVPKFQQAELNQLLGKYQIILIPSIAEGFGKAMLEGMACGLAPIGTDGTGLASFIRHGENGLLIPTRDTDAIVKAAENLINDMEMRMRFRESSRESAKLYSWTKVATQRLAVYERLLAARD
ncbi:group 1 family glycosyl transferase [Rhodopirellula maiorica SM1]|uniref:Group 1 family glycosyl transferase n=2 Tax=Novipirellula TaxID=2795426 RepID=M5RNL9_9BACT|nr:group 1 family glycosyl transferase [Rhodopirellula maiorica SM1]